MHIWSLLKEQDINGFEHFFETISFGANKPLPQVDKF